MKIKYKNKKKRKIERLFIPMVLVIVLLVISIGYAIWNQDLTIRGKANANYKEPVLNFTVPYRGNNRYTTNSEFKYALTTVLKVSSDTYSGNVLTTNLAVVYKQALNTSRADGVITLTLQNNTNDTFTNGKMELIQKVDSGGCLYSYSHSLGSTQISPGGTINPTVTLDITSRKVASGTYLKYRISYKVAEYGNMVERAFYYIVNIIPK